MIRCSSIVPAVTGSATEALMIAVPAVAGSVTEILMISPLSTLARNSGPPSTMGHPDEKDQNYLLTAEAKPGQFHPARAIVAQASRQAASWPGAVAAAGRRSCGSSLVH